VGRQPLHLRGRAEDGPGGGAGLGARCRRPCRIERAGDPERYFGAAELEARKLGWGYQELWSMPQEIRFALEMAAHEDTERRAMEGELAELERRWRAAEEIAAIADRLAVPADVERKLDWMKRRPGGA
jgi:hypothetical protein